MGKTYEIIIKNESSEESQSSTGGAGGLGGKQEKKKKEEHVYSVWDDPSKAMKKAVGTVLGAHGYAGLRKITDTIISHQNSMIEVKTGAREKQMRVTNQYNLVTSYLDSAVAGIGGGFVAAPFFGVGGVVGAGIGLAVGLMKKQISREIEIAKNTDRLNAERQLEDISRSMSAQRATVSGSRYMNATQM